MIFRKSILTAKSYYLQTFCKCLQTRIVGKEGERNKGDCVMLWCSFWLWARSNWMPFLLLFEATVWPSFWPCSLIPTWSGMRLLYDRRSHDNQSRWASLDKLILCLCIPYVDSRYGVSSSRRLLPCSPPKAQSAPQWWHNDNCVAPHHNVWSFLGMHDVMWKWRSAAIFQSLAAARNFCPCGLMTCRGGCYPSLW